MEKEMYKNLTWGNGYEVHLGLTGDRRAVIPREIADNQQEYDGKTFKALLPDGRWMRVKLVGDDYGLNTPGTGDIIVRPWDTANSFPQGGLTRFYVRGITPRGKGII